MIKKEKKYKTIFKLTWSQSIDYRFQFIFEFICCFLPVIALLFLWQAIYVNKEVIGNYNVYEMFSYVIIARFVNMIITPGFFFEVVDEIQEGLLSNYVVRPINYIGYWFCKELGNKSRSLIFGIVPILLLYLIYHKYILINYSLLRFTAFIASFLLAYITYFMIIMTASLLSFWFYEISSWFYTISFIIEFFSGAVIPIDLLPLSLQNALHVLPFKYLVYFPVSILTNNIETKELIFGIIIQIFWLLIIYIIQKTVWNYGRKKYDAYGG